MTWCSLSSGSPLIDKIVSGITVFTNIIIYLILVIITRSIKICTYKKNKNAREKLHYIYFIYTHAYTHAYMYSCCSSGSSPIDYAANRFIRKKYFLIFISL